jgi:hypothetical protein
MLRNAHFLAAVVIAAACFAGCRGDEPTDVSNPSNTTAPESGKSQPGIADDDRDDDDHDGDDDNEIPQLPPAADFVAEIDNPWLAFERGKIFHYESETEDGLETNVVEVTDGTEVILGVAATVVHDRVYLDGSLTEDTLDWFAQDKDGNVWYFGEDSKEFDHGQLVGTEGSWRAGENGAEPGLIMLADPDVGLRYRQEHARGVAEDRARIIRRHASVHVEYGNFRNCLETEETTPLEPGAREFKFYKRNVGLVLESERRNGGGERNELTAIED